MPNRKHNSEEANGVLPHETQRTSQNNLMNNVWLDKNRNLLSKIVK